MALRAGTVVVDVESGHFGTVAAPSRPGNFRVEWHERYSRELHDYLASSEWDLLEFDGPVSVRVATDVELEAALRSERGEARCASDVAQRERDAELRAAGLDPVEQDRLVERLGEVLADDADAEYGWVTVSETVTDGISTWLKTERYLYYSPVEARALFTETLRVEGLQVAS